MKQSNVVKIILAIVLLGALIASLTLVKKTQELRRGAYFAGTDIKIEPATNNQPVGTEFPVSVFVETKRVGTTGALAKVDFVQTKMCFGPQLTIDAPDPGDVSGKVTISDKFTNLMFARLVNSGTGKCLEAAVKAEKPQSQLASGMVQVMTVKLKAVEAG